MSLAMKGLLAMLLEDGQFAFQPPKDAQAIELRTLDARAIPRLTTRDP